MTNSLLELRKTAWLIRSSNRTDRHRLQTARLVQLVNIKGKISSAENLMTKLNSSAVVLHNRRTVRTPKNSSADWEFEK
jgi:hypothetical protein